jgi:probable phosphoglycerate mutase
MPKQSRVREMMRRVLLLDPPRTEIVLVRHAQQVAGELSGERPVSSDRPLSDTGRRQARLVAEYLATQDFDAVYCSDLARARDTAKAICHVARRDPPMILPRLNEVEVFGGIPPGASVTEILEEAALEGVLGAFQRTRRWDALPFTEASASLRRRSLASLEQIAAAHPGSIVCVVSHGGVMNAFLAEALSIGIDMFFQPAHASVARVYHWDSTWALLSLNYVDHLSSVDASLVTY